MAPACDSSRHTVKDAVFCACAMELGKATVLPAPIFDVPDVTTSTHSTPGPARLLAIAAAGTVAITLANPSSSRQFTWPWVLVLACVWLAPIVALVSMRQLWRRPDSLLTASLVLLALSTLISAALSPFATLSLLRIWPVLGGIALFFWLHHWLAGNAGPERSRRLGWGIAAIGAGLAVVSLVKWRWQSAEVPWLVRNDIPFGHSNHTAGAMLLILPWLVHAAWQSRGLHRLAWLMTALTSLAVLMTTSSRAGVLALGVTVAVVVTVTLVRSRWSRRTKVLLAAGAALVLVLGILTNPRLRDLALGNGWSEIARESNSQREAMLQAGWLLGAERPFWGWGPGTVPLVYPQVRAQLDAGVDNVIQLHSVPAQFWATQGAAAILALLLLVIATGRRLWQVVRAPTPTTVTAASTLLAYGLFALTDYQLRLPAIMALLVISLALLFQNTGTVSDLRPGIRRFILVLITLILLVPLGVTARDLLARHTYDEALTAYGENRGTEGMTLLENAALRAPYDPYYRHQLAGWLLTQRANVADQATRDELAASAAEQLRLSLAAGCFQEFAHLNLAWLALEADAPHLAAAHFRAALEEAPQRGGAYFGLGLALHAMQENAAAVRAFALEWVNDPAAATSPLWTTPDLASYLPSVAREAETILQDLRSDRKTADYILSLWRWWEQDGPPPTHGFNRESDQFIASLTALANNQPFPSSVSAHPWGRLLLLWRVAPSDFTALAPRDHDFAATLARRAARHPAPDVHGFLTAGPEGETNLLMDIRSARSGYGVLAFHPDGLVLTDLYLKHSPRIIYAFASTVFPPKGWLPAHELLVRLPAAPTTP